MNEIGWTPKLGKDKLEGKYAFGTYLWGQNNTQYSQTTWLPGQTKPIAFGQQPYCWGLYLQADQRLYANKVAAPAQPSLGKNPVDGKNPAPAATTTADKVRGLYSFSMFNYTPPQNNALPLYFQTGLVYKGLLDIRKNDQMGIVVGAGFYSTQYNQYIDSQNQALKNNYGSTYNETVPNGPTSQNGVNANTGAATANKDYFAYAPHYSSTEVVEAFYNIQLNKWAALKPSVQWIVNPAGNGTVGNDLLLCADLKVTF